MTRRICVLCYEPLAPRTRWQRFWGLNPLDFCEDGAACFQRFAVSIVGYEEAKKVCGPLWVLR